MNKVYTEIIIHADGSREESFYLYDGPVAECKGSDTAKEQMKAQNALQQQAFDMQRAQLAQLNSAFGKYVNGDIGYDPALKAALQSQFLNSVSQQYGGASEAVKNAILAHGGSGQLPMSGGDIRALVGLEGSRADTLSQGLLGLGVQNAQQALTNKFNAGSLLSGNAATLSSPIATFGSGANNALNAYITAANSGFGAAFTKALGGTLGAGIGNLATGGAGGGLNKLSGTGWFGG